MLRSVLISAVLLAAFQVFGYFPVSKLLPLDRYNNLDHYVNYFPACTLNLELNDHGASGWLDAHFNAPAVVQQVDVGASSGAESLEVLSVLCLPREFSIDSMVLWVEGAPQAAALVSIGQAEATYNNIVYVTRKDPAYIRRINGYPDNYGFYPFRPYENQYEVKIFPCLPGESRHVRIFVDCHADPASVFPRFNLGCPMNAVVRINTRESVVKMPSVTAGVLSLFSAQDRIGYQITGAGNNPLVLTLSPDAPPVAGAAGVIQTGESGGNYFKVSVDLEKLFNLDSLSHRRKVTFVWIPSGSKKTGPVNYYEEEKRLLSGYLSGFKPQESFNILYAGNRVEMMEPHMVQADENNLARAMDFLEKRTDPDTRSLYLQTFSALVQAFASIASTDIPAAVFCMDREPLQEGGPSPDYARVDSMKNVLVLVNVNRARFYAWVHWSKAFFYSRIASALNGTISWYDPSGTYRYPGATSLPYDFSGLDNFFGSAPVISSPRLEFDASCSNIITSSQRDRFDSPGRIEGTLIDAFGQCTENYLSGAVTAMIDGKMFRSPFLVTNRGTSASGLNLDKLWAFDMTEVFAMDRTFFHYEKTRDYQLSSPDADFALLSGNITDNRPVYDKMVQISLQHRVVTGATALLALEPGMEMLEEDSSGSGEYGPATGVLKTTANDSLKEMMIASPNPFNPSTTIRLAIKGPAQRVTIRIYGPDGKLVRTLTAEAKNGLVEIAFDGRDSGGNRLSSGVYLARAFCGNRVWQMRLLMVK